MEGLGKPTQKAHGWVTEMKKCVVAGHTIGVLVGPNSLAQMSMTRSMCVRSASRTKTIQKKKLNIPLTVFC